MTDDVLAPMRGVLVLSEIELARRDYQAPRPRRRRERARRNWFTSAPPGSILEAGTRTRDRWRALTSREIP